MFLLDFVRDYTTAYPFVLVYATAGAARAFAFCSLAMACSLLGGARRPTDRTGETHRAAAGSHRSGSSPNQEQEVAKGTARAAAGTANAQVLKLVAQLLVSAGCAALYGGRLELCQDQHGAPGVCWVWRVPLTLARTGAFAVIIAGALLFFGVLQCPPLVLRVARAARSFCVHHHHCVRVRVATRVRPPPSVKT